MREQQKRAELADKFRRFMIGVFLMRALARGRRGLHRAPVGYFLQVNYRV
jgi:hypothetical protein